MNLRLIYRILLIMVIFLTIMLLPRVAYDYSQAFRQITIMLTTLRLALLIFLLIEITRLFNDYIIKPPGGISWIKNAATLLYGLIAILVILEGIFMFVGRSHYAGYTLSAKIWFYRHWKPINAYGFRDKPVDTTKSFHIFALGDSYTAGHGLNDYEKRYSNLLEKRLVQLHPSVQVINLGKNAADTREEYSTMQAFIQASGISPDAIVLQYFGNDIEHVAKTHGMIFPGFSRYEDLPAGFSQAVESSYLLNYIYWMLPHGDIQPYISFIQDAYNDTVIFQAYLKDMDLFIDYANEQEIPLVILIYPFLQDIRLSREIFIDRMRQFFESRKIPYIDISELIEDLSVAERVVNNNDSHSGPVTNQRVADTLSGYFLETMHH